MKYLLLFVVVIFSASFSYAQTSPFAFGASGGYSPKWEFDNGCLEPQQRNYDIEFFVASPYLFKYFGLMYFGGIIAHETVSEKEWSPKGSKVVLGWSQKHNIIPIEIYGTVRLRIGPILSFTSGLGMGTYWGRMTTKLDGYKLKENNKWTSPHYYLTYFLAPQIRLYRGLSLQLIAKKRFLTLHYGQGGYTIFVDTLYGGYHVDIPAVFEVNRTFLSLGFQYSI